MKNIQIFSIALYIEATSRDPKTVFGGVIQLDEPADPSLSITMSMPGIDIKAALKKAIGWLIDKEGKTTCFVSHIAVLDECIVLRGKIDSKECTYIFDKKGKDGAWYKKTDPIYATCIVKNMDPIPEFFPRNARNMPEVTDFSALFAKPLSTLLPEQEPAVINALLKIEADYHDLAHIKVCNIEDADLALMLESQQGITNSMSRHIVEQIKDLGFVFPIKKK